MATGVAYEDGRTGARVRARLVVAKQMVAASCSKWFQIAVYTPTF